MKKTKEVAIQVKIVLTDQERKDFLCFCIDMDTSMTAWITKKIREQLKALEEDT